MTTYRKASRPDVALVVCYIEKKVAFDRALGSFDGPIGTTSERIEKALFGSPPLAYAFIAASDEKPVGFAFYHYRFSSFQGLPSLWLDDLYVDEEVRRTGAGLVLMSAVAKEAVAHDCTHIAWTADVRNPAGIPFYRKIGATLVSEQGSRLNFSVTPEYLLTRIKKIEQVPLRALHGI